MTVILLCKIIIFAAVFSIYFFLLSIVSFHNCYFAWFMHFMSPSFILLDIYLRLLQLGSTQHINYTWPIDMSFMKLNCKGRYN